MTKDRWLWCYFGPHTLNTFELHERQQQRLALPLKPPNLLLRLLKPPCRTAQGNRQITTP